MRAISGGIGRRPALWRWAALAFVAVLAVFLIWYFLFRDLSISQSNAPSKPPPPRPALGQRIPYEQYTVAVDQALSDVLDAATLSGNDQKKKLESAASALQKVEGASIEHNGATIEVDNTALISELRAAGPNLGAIGGSLSALSKSLRDQSSQALPGTMDGEQAKSALREVLSDPIFDYERDLTPLQRLARWLSGVTGNADPGVIFWRLISSVIAGLAAGTLIYLATGRLESRGARLTLAIAGGLFVAISFYGLAESAAALDVFGGAITTLEILAAIGLVVAAIAAALFATGIYRASAPTSRPRQLSDLAAALGMSASEARKQADEAAAARDYRLAIRFRSLAVLLVLDEAGMLTFDRSATNREYLFRAPGGLQDELQPLLAQFEAVWYGDAPASARDWTDFAARSAQLEARAVSEARAQRDASGRAAA